MSVSVYALLPQLASMMEIFTKLGSQHTSRLLEQLFRYRDLTDGQIGCMRLQAGTTLATAFLGGTAAIASSFFPKGAVNPTPNPEVGGSFLKNLYNTAVEKLRDNEFMRHTLKAAATAFPQVGDGFKTLFQGSVMEHDSERDILSRVRFQEAQEGQNSAQGAIEKANQLANSIIEKKSRGA